MRTPGEPEDRSECAAADEIQAFLAKTGMFPDPGIAFGLAERVEQIKAAAGETLVRAGSPGDSLYLLMRGRARVVSINATTGEVTPLESLRPGDHFGEMGPLLGVAQSFTVIADEPCLVLRIPENAWKALFARVPAFSFAIARKLAMRQVQLGLLALRPAVASGEAPARVSKTPAQAAQPNKSPVAANIVRFVEVSEYEPTPNILSMLPDRVILEQRVIPLHLDGNVLTVGMVSPKNEAALLEIRRVLNRVELDVVAIAHDDYQHALIRFRLLGAGADGKANVLKPENLTFDVIDSEREAEKAVRVIGDEVVRAVNKILCTALEREASDIHIEPDVTGVRVRFRVHGMLQDWGEFVAPSFGKGIAARLKVLAGLDITERRMPQDGRIALTVGKREVDLRMSTLPASRGEKVVLRVFEAAGMMRALDRTFPDKHLLSTIRQSLGRNTGAIVVGGATGSGKSTTLYSMLAEQRRMRPTTNVVMVEDPIEYRLQGVTQVQVNHGLGLGFAQALRSILRQDPDVIALGETRDGETARTALEAAMTGHVVLTSIHANGAVSALQRFETLGCPRELIAQSLSLILVQRLARRLCPGCARVESAPPILLESLIEKKLVDKGTNIRVPRAVGCEGCNKSGYLGRVAVIESLAVNEDVRVALMASQPMSEVESVALRSGALRTFQSYASYLMACNMIGGADALMAVAS